MKKHTTYWIKNFKQDKKFGHLRFKLLKDKGYLPFDIDKDLVDKVGLDDFVKIEENRIPFFIGTQFGIYPNIDEIPNFYNNYKLIGILGKSILSGCVAGLSIYKVYKDNKRKRFRLAHFENRKSSLSWNSRQGSP